MTLTFPRKIAEQPSASPGVEKAAEALKDVLELQGALDLDPSSREMCLEPRLQGIAGDLEGFWGCFFFGGSKN